MNDQLHMNALFVAQFLKLEQERIERDIAHKNNDMNPGKPRRTLLEIILNND